MMAVEIMDEIAIYYRCSRSQIKSRGRTDNLVKARIEIAKRLRKDRHLTTGQIGILLNRSTWTVNYYLDDKWREKRQTKMRWKKRHENLRKRDRSQQAPLHSSRDRRESLRHL